MRLLRYWCRRGMILLYLAAALLLTYLFLWQAELKRSAFYAMLPVVLGYLLLLRTADDWFDYEKDRGRKIQPLRRAELGGMLFCISAGFLCLHLLLFGAWGLLCTAAIAWIFLMNRLESLKYPYLPLLLLFYDVLFQQPVGFRQTAICLGCLALPMLYAFFKRKTK